MVASEAPEYFFTGKWLQHRNMFSGQVFFSSAAPEYFFHGEVDLVGSRPFCFCAGIFFHGEVDVVDSAAPE